MREIGLEELKQLEVEMLDVVTEFCDKKGIRYWLDGGTLIGAIRHKGFIPWDDDIDIGMLRPDYDRFIREFNGESSRYKAYSIENNQTFYYAFAKVLDLNTVLYEPDERGQKLAVYIDVFVYDSALGEEDLKHRYMIRDVCNILRVLRNYGHRPRGGLLRRMVVGAGRLVARPFPEDWFTRKLSDNSKKYANREDTELLGDFLGFSKPTLKRNWYLESTTSEFEGKTYKIPVCYDEVLRAFYGDYMQLPPPEKRISHHKFRAYMKESLTVPKI